MPAKKVEPSVMEDLFRSRLDNIINLRHELVILSKLMNWCVRNGVRIHT